MEVEVLNPIAIGIICIQEQDQILGTSESWYGQQNGSDVNRGEFKEETHGYSTENGMLASTTGNIYGIYDMNGGAWERVAAYLDNRNGNLNTYGKNNSSSIKYFENGSLKEQYKVLWNTYQVSEEEKTNQIQLSDGTKISQNDLWNSSKIGEMYQQARYRITNWTFNNMKEYKGIGVNEVATECSFYAPYGNSGSWSWFKTVADAVAGKTTYGTAWDGDYVLIGHAAYPFVLRGGDCSDGSYAGVLSSYIASGYAHNDYSFRPVLAF